MILRLFGTFKNLTIIEKFISISSLFIGSIMCFDSVSMIYAYNFTGNLYMFMTPMSSLVSNLIIGLLLVYSSLNLISNNKKTTFFYKLTGILIMLYPINLNILDYLNGYWTSKSLFFMILIPIGTILYVVFNQKKHKTSEQPLNIFNLDTMKFTIGILAFLLIDIFLNNWNYLDRTL